MFVVGWRCAYLKLTRAIRTRRSAGVNLVLNEFVRFDYVPRNVAGVSEEAPCGSDHYSFGSFEGVSAATAQVNTGLKRLTTLVLQRGFYPRFTSRLSASARCRSVIAHVC
jgi:hypothetical protein